MVRVAALLVVLVLASACVSRQGTESERQEPESELISEEQLLKADPCGFADIAALAEYGKVTVEDSIFYTDCTARVTTSGSDYVQVTAELNLEVGEDTLADFSEGERHGIPVWSAIEDEFGCERNIVPYEGMVIALTASGDGLAGTICELADAAVNEVVDQLVAGDVRTYDVAEESLLNQDACELVDDAQVARVPGIDKSVKLPAFNDQTCSWGDNDVKFPGVFVSFTHGTPPAPEGPQDSRTSVAGNEAVVSQSDGQEFEDVGVDVGDMLPSCDVDIVYRNAEDPISEVEIVGVSVRAEQAAAANCPLALEMAETAMSRLPA